MTSSGRELTQPRHPHEQEPHGLGAHHGAMVARPATEIGAARATARAEDASYFTPAGVQHTT